MTETQTRNKRTKSSHGEGSYRVLPSGAINWRRLIDGHVYSLTNRDERLLKKQIRELLSKLDRDIKPVRETRTVASFLDHWLENVIRPNRRTATYRDYRNTIRNHVLPAFGKVKLTKLQPADLETLYAGMRAKELSPKTVKNAHGIIHSALKHALRQGLVERNVADMVDPPKAPRPEIKLFSREQAKTLAQAISGSRWEAMILLAIVTGMRQSELLGLKWSDVDLDAGRVRVSRQLDRDKGLSETKTAKGRRVIDLPAVAVETLMRHRTRQLEERLLAGPECEHQDLVFCTYQGRPLGHRNVLREYSKLLERAGLPHIPFYGLRHTAATLLLEAGVPSKVVQEILGHSQVSVTLDIYSHVMPGMGREAANTWQQVLG